MKGDPELGLEGSSKYKQVKETVLPQKNQGKAETDGAELACENAGWGLWEMGLGHLCLCIVAPAMTLLIACPTQIQMPQLLSAPLLPSSDVLSFAGSTSSPPHLPTSPPRPLPEQ